MERGSGVQAAGWVRTSFGMLTWVGRRARTARAIAAMRACSAPSGLRASSVLAVMGRKKACWSKCCFAPVANLAVSTCPVMAMTGAPSKQASAKPVAKFVAPGPAEAMQTAGFPVSFASADAMNAPCCSWVVMMNCTSSCFASASARGNTASPMRP